MNLYDYICCWIFFCFFLFFVCKKHQFCKKFLQKIKSKKYGSHIHNTYIQSVKKKIAYLHQWIGQVLKVYQNVAQKLFSQILYRLIRFAEICWNVKKKTFLKKISITNRRFHSIHDTYLPINRIRSSKWWSSSRLPLILICLQ